MKHADILGFILGAASLWPVANGLAAIDTGDYLGALLALTLAWLLARTAVELIGVGSGDRSGLSR
jgi:hypothetical protein